MIFQRKLSLVLFNLPRINQGYLQCIVVISFPLCTVIRRAIKSSIISPLYHLRRINWKIIENRQVANGNGRFWVVWSFHKEGNLSETSHLSPSHAYWSELSLFYLDDLYWLINSATLLFSLEWFIHRCEGTKMTPTSNKRAIQETIQLRELVSTLSFHCFFIILYFIILLSALNNMVPQMSPLTILILLSLLSIASSLQSFNSLLQYGHTYKYQPPIR